MKFRKSPIPAAKRSTTEAPESEPEIHISELLKEADRRLKQSSTLPTGSFKRGIGDLPLYILAGAAGAGKTTAFLEADLSPELLAGQVYRDSTVLPTSDCNLWYASGSLLLELGGRFAAGEIQPWREAVRQLCARGQSPLRALRTNNDEGGVRGLVWFCDLAPFIGTSDPSRINGMARKVQQRLAAVGEALGHAYPVYVVFTKADLIPHFQDFFHQLTTFEDRQVLGCTLNSTNFPNGAEVYADALTSRLVETFNALYVSLSRRRVQLLAQEADQRKKAGIYEFPRELKRLRDPLLQFLVEALRPNSLRPSPILRGFYFTGVRQVPTGAANSTVATAQHVPFKNLDATILFQPDLTQLRSHDSASSRATSADTSSRGAFCRDLFQRVIVQDPLSQATAAKDVRRHPARRFVPHVAVAAGVLLMLCLSISWWGNRRLLSAVEQAAEADKTLSSPAAFPTVQNLRRMEQLRLALSPLIEYRAHGAPWHLRWGLYSGNSVFQRAYDAYFLLFHRYFLTETETAFSHQLARLSSRSAATGYDSAYKTLKAYRMTTSGQCPADAAFLSPVFLQGWQGDRSLNPAIRQLADNQIQFYANELTRRNPYQLAEDGNLIDRAQRYLSGFGGSGRVLSGLIHEADTPPRRLVRVTDLAPDAPRVLSGPNEMEGAFTPAGWAFAQARLSRNDRLSLGEPCVIGSAASATAGIDSINTQGELNALYRQAYIDAWKKFMTGTSLQPFHSAADASHKLEIVAGNRSPLLAMLFLVAANTQVAAAAKEDAPATQTLKTGLLGRILPVAASKRRRDTDNVPAFNIAQIFEPVRQVVPPENHDRLIGASNHDYINALASLKDAMQALAGDSASNPNFALHQQAQQSVQKGMDTVRRIAQQFNIRNSEGVDNQVKRLLESPFREAGKFIISDPAQAGRERLAAATKAFCAHLAALQKAYPFNEQSTVDATADQVSTIFGPPSGALYVYEQQIADFVVRQGRYWVPNPSNTSLGASPELLAYLNRLTAISEALFPGGAARMGMRYRLTALPGPGVESISLEIDGQQLFVPAGHSQPKEFTWPGGSGAQNVLVRVKSGANIPFASYEGMWGIFRLLDDADSRPSGYGVVEISKVRRGHGRPEPVLDGNDKPILVRLQLLDAGQPSNVFDRHFFEVHCPSQLAAR